MAAYHATDPPMVSKTTTDHKSVVRTAIESFNDRDFDAMASVHASDVVLHDNGETFDGYDAVEEHMAGAIESLGEATFTVEELIADGDRVAARYSITASSNGEDVQLTAVSMASLVDGEISEVWVRSG